MRYRSIASAAVAALFLAACGRADPAPEAAPGPTSEQASGSASDDVVIEAFEFRPHDITVSVGDTVEWTNEDDILHTVTSGKAHKQGVPGVTENTEAEPDGLFDQDMDGAGATFSFTFEELGTYGYFCSIHPCMRGVVTVD